MTPEQITIDTLRAAQASAGHAWATAWAAWIIGLGGLALNGFALAFIYRQLRTSETAANAAARATQITSADLRPWVKLQIESVTLRISTTREHLAYSTVKWKVNNVGKTPAIEMDVQAKLVIDSGAYDYDAILAELRGRDRKAVRTAFPGDDLEETTYVQCDLRHIDRKKEADWIGPEVVAIVRYKASGGEEHETPLVVQLWPDDDAEDFTFTAKTLREEGERKVSPLLSRQHKLSPT